VLFRSANVLTTVTGGPAYANPANYDANGGLLYDQLDLTVTNAYPGYSGTVTFGIVNNGTVPLYVTPGTAVVRDAGNNDASSLIGVTVPDYSSTVVAAGSTQNGYSIQISIANYAAIAQKATYHVTVPLTATQNIGP